MREAMWTRARGDMESPGREDERKLDSYYREDAERLSTIDY